MAAVNGNGSAIMIPSQSTTSFTQRPGRLLGKVAIVTGGSAGFGAAITEQFVQEGAKVVIIDIDQKNGQLMEERSEGNVSFLHGDVTKASTWTAAGELAIQKYGRITTVVNNAGITNEPKPVHEQTMELYDRIMNINLRPIFLSAQALAPIMAKTPGSSFVNISSTGYTRPRPGFAFYNASKAGVTAASKTMALEYAPHVRFNCIAPSIGNTAMLQMSIRQYADPAARLAEICKTIPMGRPTEPSDVGNAAIYLASDEASFVTGTLLEVDGGRGV